ncbi:Prefoldin subunit 1 [Parelaphostrongylus tenuis]|uniref:Prefoldin subunit 1 n=1 Tax=Parelaphostrongylus tenuis TaxID=148309 RepID=A0AAD5WCX7_PARTN|nr:Prefoldin subunit 1 [Parelaphostrongylus tenuis]
MADEELKKFKTNENRALITQGEVAKKVNAQKQRRSELSAASIAEVPDGHEVYRSVGRMFLLSTKAAEIERHNQEALESKQKIESLNKQKEYLQRGLEEAEQNLREMIQARRA